MSQAAVDTAADYIKDKDFKRPVTITDAGIFDQTPPYPIASDVDAGIYVLIRYYSDVLISICGGFFSRQCKDNCSIGK